VTAPHRRFAPHDESLVPPDAVELLAVVVFELPDRSLMGAIATRLPERDPLLSVCVELARMTAAGALVTNPELTP